MNPSCIRDKSQKRTSYASTHNSHDMTHTPFCRLAHANTMTRFEYEYYGMVWYEYGTNQPYRCAGGTYYGMVGTIPYHHHTKMQSLFFHSVGAP